MSKITDVTLNRAKLYLSGVQEKKIDELANESLGNIVSGGIPVDEVVLVYENEPCADLDEFIYEFWNKVTEYIVDRLETMEYRPNNRKENFEKIKTIAEHYSKKKQWLKTLEELEELTDELDGAGNPFGLEDIVNLPGNTWSECADVFIMIMQLTIQHNKENEFWQQVEYKLNRQLKRMETENG